MVDFNDGSIYVEDFEWPSIVGENQSTSTASMRIAHRALIGYRDVKCEVFIDGSKVAEHSRRVWATALGMYDWTIDYPVVLPSGPHDISFRFSYVSAGDVIENVTGSFEKQGTVPNPSPPPEPGTYTITISAPSSVVVGEPFDVSVQVCCEGASTCPAGPYRLTAGHQTLIETDLMLDSGSCENALTSTESVSFTSEGTYTLQATAGEAQATHDVVAVASSEPPSDEPPNGTDPPSDGASGSLLPLAVAGFIILADDGDN